VGDQRRRHGPDQHADDVEAQFRRVLVVGGQPPLGQGPEPALLDRPHRLHGVTEADRPAGLHLAEDERVPLTGDDVELAVPAAPVPVEDPQALVGEVGGGDALAVGAEIRCRSHPPTVRRARALFQPRGGSVDSPRGCGRRGGARTPGQAACGGVR
jgi:hypothetical protein